MSSRYFVVVQGTTKRDRSALIEQNTHLGRGQRASGRMLENRANLLKRNTRKPFDELRYQGTVFEVLKQGGNGHASSAENPSPAHAFRIPLDGGTRGPINHL